MKKLILAASIVMLFLSSCEVEMRDNVRYRHYRGYEHSHYPNHHDVYNHGYHHNGHGDEIIIEHR